MRPTLRTKLLAILGVASLSFAVLLVSSAWTDERVEQQLVAIAERYVPSLDVGPKLAAQLDRLPRALQDAVAAQDYQALEDTHRMRDELLAQLSASEELVSAADGAAFRSAVEAYYASAYDVSRRLMAEETGEALVAAMAAMQAQHTRASELLEKMARVAQGELRQAFERAAAAQASAQGVRLLVSVGCIATVLVLSLWLSQRILRALADLGAGLTRFGGGDFRVPIQVASRDEFGELAHKANEMAANLERLQADRDKDDWQKAGYAGLVQELQGDMEPADVARHAARFLARYLEAPAGALYQVESDGALCLLGHYGGADENGVRPRFVASGGLVGRAALEQAITIVKSLPDDYMKIRSGLGEAAPSGLALLPLIRLGRVVGVLELAFFGSWPASHTLLLESVRETLAITLEVARTRSAVRGLLLETQKQATRLSAQEEELRATNDELQGQQEELRATNEELTLQTNELERQRLELEHKNAELTEVRHTLEKKAEELGTVSAYKSQFLANMSHELRTPLNSMLLLSSLLADNETKNLTDKQVEYCKTVNQAGQDLLALINQVLDLSKVEAGKQGVQLDTVTLQSLALHAQRLFEPLVRDKGLTLSVELDGRDLPPTIVTDARRVEQILNNLLGNAVKFTEHGTVSLMIRSPTAGEGPARADLSREQCVAFVVSDTGIGINMEHRERIFAPFEQLEASPDRRYGGTGLGLAISRELSGLLGGELSLRSAVGEGSTFVLYLPFDGPARSASAPPRPLPPPPNTKLRDSRRAAAPVVASSRAPGPALLLIEDDPLFASALGEVIQNQGLSYMVAEDGETGLRMAKQHKPLGIVLDVKLPDFDGFTLMEMLRSDPATATIPVHFVSALDASERGLALGAIGYLTKPTTRADLVRMVESLVPGWDRLPVGTSQNGAAGSGPFPAMRWEGRKILVADDDMRAAYSLSALLRTRGVQPLVADTGRAALAALGENPDVEAVLMDIMMPEMDGYEAMRRIRQDPRFRSLPIIALTAKTLRFDKQQCLEAGATGYIAKPVEAELLFAMLQSTLVNNAAQGI